MPIKNAILSCLLALPLLVSADELQLRADHPQTYVVVKGDTLWDISGRFLTKPWRWPEIWQGNPQIENPHLIYPGDVISLVYVDGRPTLRVGDGAVSLGGRDIKLSPSTREYRRDRAVPPIPLDAIHQFLTRPLVATEEELDAAPYVVSSFDEHLVAGSGNKIYVRGLTSGESVTQFSVYRKGDAYRDGKTGELLGYEALYVGDAVLQRVGDPASLILTRTDREVLIGDRLLPLTEEVDPLFIPHSPATEVDGHIISGIDTLSQIGQLQVVVIDRGIQDGLQAGHVLGVSQTGKIVRDYIGTESDAKTLERKAAEREAEYIKFDRSGEVYIDTVLENLFNDVKDNADALADAIENTDSGVEVELPAERIGEVMVFRPFERVSYALVMKISRPVHIMDSVSNP